MIQMMDLSLSLLTLIIIILVSKIGFKKQIRNLGSPTFIPNTFSLVALYLIYKYVDKYLRVYPKIQSKLANI